MYALKEHKSGVILTSTDPIFLGCCFPPKIKNLGCSKPPVPLVGQKNLGSTWNIEPAGYLLKPPFQVFLVSKNILNSWFFMENSILKKLVPWMLKSPLTSVHKKTSYYLVVQEELSGVNVNWPTKIQTTNLVGPFWLSATN